VLALTLTGLVSAWLIDAHLEVKNAAVTAQADLAATKAAEETVRRVEEGINRLQVAQRLADEISAGETTYEALPGYLEVTLNELDNVGITVGYFPEYAPESIERVPDAAIYFTVGHKDGETVSVSNKHYTNKQVLNREQGDISAWYKPAEELGKGVWIGSPYYSPITNAWWIGGYSVPFYISGELAGVVTAELTLEQARHAMFQASESSFDNLPIDSNMGLLISETGQIISHPDRTLVEERRHVSDFIPDITDMSQIRKLPRVSDEEKGVDIFLYDHFNYEISGQTFSVYFAPVADTGWWAAIVLDLSVIDETSDNMRRIRHTRTGLVIAEMIFVFGLLLLVLRVDKFAVTKLWIASIGFAVLCIIAVGYLLWLNIDSELREDSDDVVVKNRAISGKVQIQYEEQEEQEWISIPTGVFVQSAEFSSANDVTITGFIWQRYDDSLPMWLKPDPDQPEPGFVLPESEQTDVHLAYQREQGSSRLYGWYFSAVLRQEFDYLHYPFDLENVWIRMWHKEIGRGVILTPDLGAYDSLVPEKLPGLELQDFVLEGWDIMASFFSYRFNSYNTNWGINDYAGQKDIPELYFNISLKRNFVNAFIMNFITLTVVAFLLFAVLLTIRAKPDTASLMGFNVSGVLGFCAALFFVVILAHTSLRESLAAQQLVYLEYFYFIMYGAFLGVSINAILVASETRSVWIRFGDNAIARWLFWPLLGLSLLVITLITFA